MLVEKQSHLAARRDADGGQTKQQHLMGGSPDAELRQENMREDTEHKGNTTCKTARPFLL